MNIEARITTEDRILQLLQHLGIGRAHFAARVPGDWQRLVRLHRESVASLTLLCPQPSNIQNLAALGTHLLITTGDQGREAATWRQSLEGLSGARLVALPGCLPTSASDIVANHTVEVGTAMVEFLESIDANHGVQPILHGSEEGEAAGILYRIQGSGPPLVLCPLQYAPSQWDCLLPRLSQKYCTITLSGPCMGAIRNLEDRANGGYLEVVRRVVDEARLRPGERVLDVGCGPGSLDRWLTRYTGCANLITGLDPSTYLLREAEAMVKSEGLEGVVSFCEGSGDSLPFPEGSFEVVMSFTAMQFVDANQMLREAMRVINPGGRVAVLARADDRPTLINAPLGAELKAKVEGHRHERSNELGCNDSSLYRRFVQAGLSEVKMFPQLATFTPTTDAARLEDIEGQILTILTHGEAEEFTSAVAQARAEGSYFVAEWFHCAVGTKS